jgi:hypothetical protein
MININVFYFSVVHAKKQTIHKAYSRKVTPKVHILFVFLKAYVILDHVTKTRGATFKKPQLPDIVSDSEDDRPSKAAKHAAAPEALKRVSGFQPIRPVVADKTNTASASSTANVASSATHQQNYSSTHEVQAPRPVDESSLPPRKPVAATTTSVADASKQQNNSTHQKSDGTEGHPPKPSDGAATKAPDSEKARKAPKKNRREVSPPLAAETTFRVAPRRLRPGLFPNNTSPVARVSSRLFVVKYGRFVVISFFLSFCVLSTLFYLSLFFSRVRIRCIKAPGESPSDISDAMTTLHYNQLHTHQVLTLGRFEYRIALVARSPQHYKLLIDRPEEKPGVLEWHKFPVVEITNGEEVVVSLFPDSLVRLLVQITLQ